MTETVSQEDSSARQILRRFFVNRSAVFGLVLVVLMLAVAVFAPLLANERPLLAVLHGSWSFPAFRGLFTTRSPEVFIELGFNALLLYVPAVILILWILRGKPRIW